MSKPSTLNPEEFTKADLMRHLMRQNINMSCQDAGKLYGNEEFFSSSHFSAIKTEIKEEIKAEKKQLKLFEKKETPSKKRNGAAKETATSITALQLENAYLRWQLEGERQSFFDRWLEEHEDGKT